MKTFRKVCVSPGAIDDEAVSSRCWGPYSHVTRGAVSISVCLCFSTNVYDRHSNDVWEIVLILKLEAPGGGYCSGINSNSRQYPLTRAN